MENAWTERISDYVDGAMDAAEAARFEARMAEDPALAAAVDEVRALVTEAGALDGIDPPDHLWDSIAAALPSRHRTAADTPIVDLATERERRGLSFTSWQAIAAALTLAVLSGAMGWILRGTPQTPSTTDVPQVAQTETPRATRDRRHDDVEAVHARYEEENAHLAESIRDLELVLRDNRDRLDEETLAIVEDNLVVIDRAIRDAMAALGQDPDSEYLRNHLASSMQRKARLLEDATRLSRREI